jgi:hypothetical protein
LPGFRPVRMSHRRLPNGTDGQKTMSVSVTYGKMRKLGGRIRFNWNKTGQLP